MEQCKVTVAIPFFNAERYLAYAVKSVLNQTLADWELLLIDDGSTDGSTEIARSFCSDPRVRVISDGKNRGLVARLNESVALANGEFYARMDADDIMHPRRLEREFEFLVRHNEIDVIGSGYYSIDAENNIMYLRRVEPELNRLYPRFLHPSAMARTEWFRQNPYRAEWERMEDFELWMRTGATSRIYSLQEPLMFYREFGMPSYAKYVKSMKGLAHLFKRRREYAIPPLYSMKIRVITLMKIILARTVYLFCNGNLDLLVRLRKVENIPFDKAKAEQALREAIKNPN